MHRRARLYGVRFLSVTLLATLLRVAPVSAAERLRTGPTLVQHASGGQPPPERRRRWELELGGGATFSSVPSGGTAFATEPAAVLQLGSLPPSRRVSSWYFGDGSVLLNQFTAQRGAPITPLDPTFRRPFLQRGSGASFGIRIRRELGDRFSAELSVDSSLARLRIRKARLNDL